MNSQLAQTQKQILNFRYTEVPFSNFLLGSLSISFLNTDWLPTYYLVDTGNTKNNRITSPSLWGIHNLKLQDCKTQSHHKTKHISQIINDKQSTLVYWLEGEKEINTQTKTHFTKQFMKAILVWVQPSWL